MPTLGLKWVFNTLCRTVNKLVRPMSGQKYNPITRTTGFCCCCFWLKQILAIIPIQRSQCHNVLHINLTGLWGGNLKVGFQYDLVFLLSHHYTAPHLTLRGDCLPSSPLSNTAGLCWNKPKSDMEVKGVSYSINFSSSWRTYSNYKSIEWVIKFDGLSRTVDIKVHVIHSSHDTQQVLNTCM